MPCYRCGTRQSDPVRGPSSWARGVRRGEQVLVCPDCQRGGEWQGELDRCPDCGSTRLLRALGELRCRACGAVRADEAPAATGSAQLSEKLSAEVAAAVEHVLGRGG